MGITAAAIRVLIQKGMSADDIADVADAMEACAPAHNEARSKAAIRQAKYRERAKEKTSQSVTECNETHNEPSRDDEAFPLSPSPLLFPHTPKTTPHPHTPVNNKPARGTRLPADWQPKPLTGGCAEAVSRWQAGTLERELSKFRDWAASASGPNAVKKDWDAAWRNWIRNAEERHGTANRKHRQNTANEDGFLSAIRHVANHPDHPQWRPD